VARLSKGNDAGIADDLPQGLQIGETVARLNRGQPNRMITDPRTDHGGVGSRG
jgi:hypothetical protein